MIDPKDIFNAHRVVKSPINYRPTRGLVPKPKRPSNPAPQYGWGNEPVVIFRGFEPERRGAIVRTVARSIGDTYRRARQATVRTVLPRVRKR